MAGIFGLLMSGAGVIKDQYYNLTSLLLPGNGTDGKQNRTFKDSSVNDFLITPNGNATQGTFSPFSQTGWGNYFDGSNDSLTVSSNAAFGFGTGDFCVEFWMYPTALTTARGIYLTNATGGLYIYTDTSNKLIVRVSAVATLITSNDAISLNTWTHVAVCRTGTTLSLYLNGSRTAGGTASNSTNFAAGDLYIGAEINTLYYSGYLGSLRAVKGSAVYDPTATTITVPTAPLSAVSGTSLLTCQYNRFRDASSNGFTVTPNNGAAITPFSPFAPTSSYSAAAVGGSGYFDGSGDYLSASGNSAFDLGSGDFTIEAWVYTQGSGTRRFVDYSNGTAANSNFSFFMSATSGNVAYGGVFIGTTAYIVTGTTTITNSWTHVALVRNGTASGNLKLYVNGVAEGTAASVGSNAINTLTGTPYLSISGYYNGSAELFHGSVSNVRIVKGQALASGNFTPPSAPITTSTVGWTGANAAGSITGTVSLLLNFTNAGVVDATAKNVLETVGNAQISTTQSKWGGGSISFDGTGDYLLNNNAVSDLLAFGSGDFTIEMWVRFASITTGVYTLYDARPSGTQGAYASIALDQSTAKIYYYVSSAIRITATNTVSANTWYHIALCRSGTSTKLFINGAQEGSTWTDTTTYLNPSARPSIGASGASLGSEALNGYVDDLRVTKGLARYTGSTYTVPTAPFPVQ